MEQRRRFSSQRSLTRASKPIGLFDGTAEDMWSGRGAAPVGVGLCTIRTLRHEGLVGCPTHDRDIASIGYVHRFLAIIDLAMPALISQGSIIIFNRFSNACS